MTPVYKGLFGSNADVIKEFEAPITALDGAEVLLAAAYDYIDYDGDAIVVFRKDGKLFEVNGGYCSCCGLEGQWEPEETSIEALEHRATKGWLTDVYRQELPALVAALKAEQYEPS